MTVPLNGLQVRPEACRQDHLHSVTSIFMLQQHYVLLLRTTIQRVKPSFTILILSSSKNNNNNNKKHYFSWWMAEWLNACSSMYWAISVFLFFFFPVLSVGSLRWFDLSQTFWITHTMLWMTTAASGTIWTNNRDEETSCLMLHSVQTALFVF